MTESSWANFSKGFLPGIPGYSLLENSDKIKQANLKALSSQAAASLAAAGYRLKDGASVAVSYPSPIRDDITSMAYYLHGIRWHAILQELKASWFNVTNIQHKKDLICFTRPASRFVQMKSTERLYPCVVNISNIAKSSQALSAVEDRPIRTLLASPNKSPTDLMDYFVENTAPFAFLIDATPSGGIEQLSHLLQLADIYFPKVPKCVIYALGDQEVEKIVNQHQGILCWPHRMLDTNPWIKVTKEADYKINQVTIPDYTLDNALIKASDKCRELAKALSGATKTVSSPAKSPLYRVFSGVSHLACHFDRMEQVLNSKRKGGPFPIKPLSEELYGLSSLSLPSGIAQNALRESIDAVSTLIDVIKSGLSGKAQFLKKVLAQYPSDKFLVLVDKVNTAEATEKWLVSEECIALASERIRVLPASGLRNLDKLKRIKGEKTIWLAKPWDNIKWWLYFNNEIFWPCYPSEVEPTSRLLNYALKSGLQSRPDSPNKLKWWLYCDEGQPDLAVHEFDVVEQLEFSDCKGDYIQLTLSKISTESIKSWLDIMMEEEVLIRSDEKVFEVVLDSEHVVVDVEERDEPIFLDRNHNIDVLIEKRGEKELERVAACDLKTGYIIILPKDGQERDSMRDTLFEMLSSSTDDLEHYVKFASLWYDFIDGCMDKCGSDIRKLKDMLEKGGIKVTSTTLRNWCNHVPIGPKNAKTQLSILAKLSGIKNADSHVNNIVKFIKQLRSEHVRMGKILNKVILSKAKGDSHVRVDGQLVKNEDIEQLFELLTVEVVTARNSSKSGLENVVEKRSLLSAMEGAVSRFGSRIELTARAKKSLKDSQFEDIDKALRCIGLLGNDYYDVYTKTIRLDEAISAGKSFGITYAGDLSDSSKGKNSVFGKVKEDMDRHLRIGTSYDPKFCFRLYFGWDDANKKIMIHHAGKHL